MGIAVSKRVSKLAVRRNRIKRIIREAFRLKYSDLSNVDCVVVAKARAGRVDDGQLWADLSILFDQFIKTWVDC